MGASVDKYSAYIGIDPGMKGGIAVIYGNIITAIPMPVKDGMIDVRKLTAHLERLTIADGWISGNVCCYIEKVGAYPIKGSKSIWSFGFTTGMIHSVIMSLDIPLFNVLPQVWKRKVLPNKDHSKIATINYISELYPSLNLYATQKSKIKHDGMADAVCIALYGKGKHEG